MEVTTAGRWLRAESRRGPPVADGAIWATNAITSDAPTPERANAEGQALCDDEDGIEIRTGPAASLPTHGPYLSLRFVF